MMNNEGIGNYNIDAMLQTLGKPTVTFCGKTFAVNESFNNFRRVEKLIKQEPEKSVEILIEGVLGKPALEHFNANEETISARMIEKLSFSIPAAVLGIPMEEAERRFRGQF